MNEVIKELHEIEAEAGKLMEGVNVSRQVMQDDKKKQMEEISLQLEAEMEGRLTILKTRLEEQAQEQIQQLVEKNQEQIEQLNETYQKNISRYAREIVEKITEV